ncbi:hypothetical protein BDV18DRAFT_161949 [Aspergillus unguis]
MDAETFSYIYHHVILPPKLPSEPERKRNSLERELITLVQEALSNFVRERPPDAQKKWMPVVRMIHTMLIIDVGGVDLNRNQDALQRALGKLKTDGAIALHVTAQNCGWLAHYDIERDKIIIDAFEVSATSSAIIKATDSLIRCFPGQSVAIPAAKVDDSAFCKYLANILCRLTLEVVRQMCPKAADIRQGIEEIRDTNHPGLITEGLMAQLLAYGEHSAHKSFEKHIRDEVNYSEGTLPWRRSPLWFVVKVSIQTILYRAFPGCEGRTEYKNFMLYLVSQISSIAILSNHNVTDVQNVLAVVRAKIARRVCKLQGNAFDFMLKRVAEINDATTQYLEDRRAEIQNLFSSTMPSAFGHIRESDLATSLKTSGQYLHDAMMHTPAPNSGPSFNRTYRKRNQFHPNGLPKIEDDDLISLLDFEAWVAIQLQSWGARYDKANTPSWKICCSLAELIGKYCNIATVRYGQDPVATSSMFLVIMELWVALDKLCILHCPLLEEFPPEIPRNFLKPLLLPHRDQMQREQIVEEYVASRYSKGKSTVGVFADPGPLTFAARYYDRHAEPKKLRRNIEELATRDRDDRRKLWEARTIRYQELLSKSSEMIHDTEYNEWGDEVHQPSCDKCQLERTAANLQIEIHEWPLPEDDYMVKNVVFELNCPRWFSQWRDITWKILDDYGRPQARERSKAEMELLHYPATKRFTSDFSPRLTLASTTKSWTSTHYEAQKFPVDFYRIAKPNTFCFALWDGEKETWVKDRRKSKPSVKRHCTFSVHASGYANLQYAVESCGHHQNSVLAHQRDCHFSITLHEMSAFCHLRSGERLQWYNITRELVSPTLSMNNESVHNLFCQAAWELGSPIAKTQHTEREAHVFFKYPDSVGKLLQSLESRLNSIRLNWNEHYTMHTLVVLGARVLSLCPASAIQRTVSFLQRCRQISMEWCASLVAHVDSKPNSDYAAHLVLLFRLAGICLLTFAVEEKHFSVLLKSQVDFQALVRSSILFFENTPKPVEDHTPNTKALILQVTRVLRQAERQVSELIGQDSLALNNAVRQTVAHLQFTTPWHLDGGDNSRWAKNESSSTSIGDTQDIRYNILSGELLIDNQPPGRLPENYTKHPQFQRLFGQRALSVIPSALSGSVFASTQRFNDYQVHFRLEYGHLTVKATRASEILRLIPHEVLLEDFPDSLVTNHVHWLDLETGVLEFRPLEQAWHQDPSNWYMPLQNRVGESSSTRQGKRRLVDVHSSLFAKITGVLQSLDAPKHICVSVTQDDIIEAKLVRLQLNFFVNDQQALECREHNATVDLKYDLGCLYSLSNKLILKGKTGQCHRTVLIPYGTVKLAKGALSTEVSIEPPNTPRIKCFHYLVDTTLGMLSDSTCMASALYLAYLHAVATFVLPDGLTKRSGTEEALRILRQARMKTSFPLDLDCIRLLEHIATLTPRRQYHPPGMAVMQRINWIRNLGELAQHDDFRPLAQEIYNNAARFVPFYPERTDPPVPLGLDRGDLPLLERAQARHSQFHRVGFGGASRNDTVQPVVYSARDRANGSSDRSRRVYEIATLIRDWPSTISRKEDLFEAMKNWGNIELQIRSPDQYSYTALLESPIQKLWGSLYCQCRTSKRETETYKLTQVFCAIAFGGSEIWHLRPLLAIAFTGSFPEIPQQLFRESVQIGLEPGQKPGKADVQRVISPNYPPYKSDYGANSGSMTRSEKDKIRYAQKRDYDRRKKQRLEALASMIVNQWPDTKRPSSITEQWQVKSFADCETLLNRRNKDARFFQIIEEVQKKLDAISVSPSPIQQPPTVPDRLLIFPRCDRKTLWQPPCLDELLRSTCAPSPMDIDGYLVKYQAPMKPACSDENSVEIEHLRSLITSFCQSHNDLRRHYGDNLLESLEALGKVELPHTPPEFPVSEHALTGLLERLRAQRDCLWAEIYSALMATGCTWKRVVAPTFWPSITTLSVISFLAADNWCSVPMPWKKILITYARCISSLRRRERLLEHLENKDVNLFYKEAGSAGCEGWDALEVPDWLLLELESNLTIRERQAAVAKRMIAPDTESNSVLQLNMGEGKTTVITPMIAACLADGSQLLRIIVLKPLLRQSVDVLSRRLGGLLNRRIYHVPISRRTKFDEKTLERLRDIFVECKRKRGILIVLPEQILSFRLAGLDQTSDEALGLVELEQNHQAECRTIIDESDEVLDPKFQLVYTRGNQQNVDGEADRWEVIQHILGVVEEQAVALQAGDQSGLHIERLEARYPLLHFIKPDAVAQLLQKVTEAVREGALPGVSFKRWTQQTADSAQKFICTFKTTPTDKEVVRETFQGTVVMKKLLVLRGLFAHHILQFVLAGKRWLVDYGVDPARCLMAVPFRAKGVPSENAEFGHSDVALTLTCLSYYYEGLTENQVRQCFHLLRKDNDPGVEYERWIKRQRENLPDGLHYFTGVNLEDKQAFETSLYPHLRYQKGIIDFFLTRVVFPKEAKEFPFKLSTSAWDIPSSPGQLPTTGFSGTNDNRYLLPKSMPQKDMPHLLHTNAMVLDQLLRKENRQCIVAEDENGHQLSVTDLIRLVNKQDPEIKVIIDVGAHILESSNEEVAKLWLKESTLVRAAAAIYFNAGDEAMVVDREGYKELLVASPFRGQMHTCLVFLDQHHARGVDLQLPKYYRAAVTLGPRLTKDRLVQACHRMRELGNGQSVTFLIPPAVRHSMKIGDAAITSFEVIHWVLEQTCEQLEKLESLWAYQGLQYFRCDQIWQEFRAGNGTPQDIVSDIQEAESKSLLQLYAPWGRPPCPLEAVRGQTLHNPIVGELFRVWDRAALATTQLHEEQEREITQEVEREQHVCRPPSVTPRDHKLDAELKHFVRNGQFPNHVASRAVRPAFSCLSQTSAARFTIPPTIGLQLWATVDFLETIQMAEGPDTLNDEFLKPVNWILSNIKNDQLVIISQFEANELLPDIRKSDKVALHMYTPRITKDMRTFSKLDFLTIGTQRPDHSIALELIQALEILSGSLYFDTFAEYEAACHFFGFVTDKITDIPEDAITSEGFVDERARAQLAWPVKCPFSTSPLPLLKTWYAIRTKGHGFSRSHIGTILDARRLKEDQF